MGGDSDLGSAGRDGKAPEHPAAELSTKKANAREKKAGNEPNDSRMTEEEIFRTCPTSSVRTSVGIGFDPFPSCLFCLFPHAPGVLSGTRFLHNGGVVASTAAPPECPLRFERAHSKGWLIKGAFHLWILECQRHGRDLMLRD